MSKRRRGVALLSVLAALVLLGTLAAGVALEALRLQRAARRSVAAHAAAAAVESAIHERMARWPVETAWLARGAQWADATGHERGLDTPLEIELRIVRVSATAYRVVATAVASTEDGRIVARRTAGRVVVLRAPPLTPTAAMLAFGPPAVAEPTANGTTIAGGDTLVAGWECNPADSATVAGLAVPASATFEPLPGAIAGAPPLLALADDSLHALVAALDAWLDAARRSTTGEGAHAVALRLHDGTLHAPVLAPSLDAGGECDGNAALNWGDPRRVTRCADARPLVWIRGSLIQPRGRSQGVLVVDGDLQLGGGFTHHGVVVVRGTVGNAAVPDAEPDAIVGALVLAHPSPAGHDIRSLRVRHSSCVARTALRAISVAAPAPGGWREGW